MSGPDPSALGPDPSALGPDPSAEGSAAAAGDPAPVPARATADAPSADVAPAVSAALPGEHRGGFQREFTEPVPITQTTKTEADWTAAPAPRAADALPRSGAWALVFGILGLGVSFLVGWGFLIGLVGAGLAIAALRRPWESRSLAVWALCLSLVSVIYSAGWLWWASTQGPLFG